MIKSIQEPISPKINTLVKYDNPILVISRSEEVGILWIKINIVN